MASSPKDKERGVIMAKKTVYEIGKIRVIQDGGSLSAGSEEYPICVEVAMLAIFTVAKYLHWIGKNPTEYLPNLKMVENERTMLIDGRKVLHFTKGGTKVDYACFTRYQIQGFLNWFIRGDNYAVWPLPANWYELSWLLDIHKAEE